MSGCMSQRPKYQAQAGVCMQDNPGNRLVELRSNAGTHDVDFGVRTLQDLKNCRDPDHTAYVPRYDKSTLR